MQSRFVKSAPQLVLDRNFEKSGNSVFVSVFEVGPGSLALAPDREIVRHPGCEVSVLSLLVSRPQPRLWFYYYVSVLVS